MSIVPLNSPRILTTLRWFPAPYTHECTFLLDPIALFASARFLVADPISTLHSVRVLLMYISVFSLSVISLSTLALVFTSSAILSVSSFFSAASICTSALLNGSSGTLFGLSKL